MRRIGLVRWPLYDDGSTRGDLNDAVFQNESRSFVARDPKDFDTTRQTSNQSAGRLLTQGNKSPHSVQNNDKGGGGRALNHGHDTMATAWDSTRAEESEPHGASIRG